MLIFAVLLFVGRKDEQWRNQEELGPGDDHGPQERAALLQKLKAVGWTPVAARPVVEPGRPLTVEVCEMLPSG